MARQRGLPGWGNGGRRGGISSTEARDLLSALRRDAVRIAARFGLTYRDLQAERPGAPHYGICYGDGLIKIRLVHRTRGTALKYSSLVHTLCHELAHLAHFDHGPQFQAYLTRVLEWARRDGLYRPGPGQGNAPPGTCGVDAATRRRFLRQMRSRLGGGTSSPRSAQLDLFSAAEERGGARPF